MKKALIFSSLLILVLCLGLFGCGSDGNTISPNPNPTTSTTGSLEGAVVDQDSNKIPSAFIAGKPYTTTSSQIAAYAFTAQTQGPLDEYPGNYEIDNIYPGTYEVWGWPNQTQFGEEPDNPVFKYLVTITAGQSTNQILRYGYFFIANPIAGRGNLDGRVLENASTVPNRFIVVNSTFNDLTAEQDNMFTAYSDSQGYYLIEDIFTGECEINVYNSRDDFEAVLDPIYSGTGYIIEGMTQYKDLQYGNMAGQQ